MSHRFRRRLCAFIVLGLVLTGFGIVTMSDHNAPGLSFQAPTLAEVLVGNGQHLDLNDPDPAKLYIAESGSSINVTRSMSDPERTRTVNVIARGGSHVEARGTNISVTAEPGSQVTVGDGVSLDARGAVVFVHGTARLKAFAGTVAHNDGTADAHVYAGSITYTQGRGRTIAESGATVYAKSPDDCDACTQVVAGPGSTAYVYDGAEVFGKGATVYVFKGGEVKCSRRCTLYLYPGAEFNYSPDCVVHMMTDDAPKIPFTP